MTSSEVLNMRWGGDEASYAGYCYSPSSNNTPAATAIPVAPPAPLFPGTAGAISAAGPGAVATGTKAYSDAASGLDIGKIFQSVVDASKRGGDTAQSNIMASMGASGMATSSDAMKSVSDFQLQYQADLLKQLETMQFMNEGIKMQGAQGLMETYANAGMAFAPTQEVVGTSSGPSAFSQVAGAASGSAVALAAIYGMGSDAGWWG